MSLENEKKYRVSEKFYSCQGEATYCGKLTAWCRFFLCNLQCKGFSQDNPADPKSWEGVSDTIDLSSIKRIEDLPIFTKGCDSAYSVAKRFQHLIPEQTAKEIADDIINKMKNQYNPAGLFKHPNSSEYIHMCFTGGEPMLRQDAIIEILQYFIDINNKPKFVTIETNGTQKLNDELRKFIIDHYTNGAEWLWSISPKLLNTAGEQNKKAIKPEIVAEYHSIANVKGHMKFVLNGSSESWNELDDVIPQYQKLGIQFPIWVMPVGASKEQQELPSISEIADEAIRRGYHVAARLHCYIWDNPVGK
jgi:7-carboxy-7-deazaguanine synthase